MGARNASNNSRSGSADFFVVSGGGKRAKHGRAEDRLRICQEAGGELQDLLGYVSRSGSSARSRAGIVAAAGDTIEGTRTTTSQVNWSAVPTWSDADILAQFPLQRDVRYMTGTDNPSVSRRISWMYPTTAASRVPSNST